MLLGIWRNIKELEINLSLPELEMIVTASREKELRNQKFMAALKGVSLDDNGPTAAEKVEEMKKRLAANKSGKTVDELDLLEIGFEIEKDEE